MNDMDHVFAVQEAVDALNEAVAAAAAQGLTVEHEILSFETLGKEPRPQIETTISRRLERASS
ncbi:hypothetical protein KUV28_21700 [Ferrimonas balearica]|nr:hypothetical protein [Ferrimonas balearica]